VRWSFRLIIVPGLQEELSEAFGVEVVRDLHYPQARFPRRYVDFVFVGGCSFSWS